MANLFFKGIYKAFWNWLILGLRQRKHNTSLQHLVAPERLHSRRGHVQKGHCSQPGRAPGGHSEDYLSNNMNSSGTGL